MASKVHLLLRLDLHLQGHENTIRLLPEVAVLTSTLHNINHVQLEQSSSHVPAVLNEHRSKTRSTDDTTGSVQKSS